MSTYLIPECNMEKLASKLKTISNKCKKYNCDFHYADLGEQFIEMPIEVSEGVVKKMLVKYHQIEVSGTVLAESGWQFVALLSHRTEGNVVRQFDLSLEIPQKYFSTSCVCEHCNTNRYRAETCLLYNAEQDSWKQVGKSCLKEFTGTFTAEHAAAISSWLDQFQAAADADMMTLSKGPKWINVAAVLKYAGECVRHFGYVCSGEPWATGEIVSDIIDKYELGGRMSTAVEKRLSTVEFDADRSENLQQVSDIITWLLDPETADGSSYINNLQTIIKSKYCKLNEIAIVSSAVKCYQKHLRDLEIARERQAAHDVALKSNWIGNKGERLTISLSHAELVTSFDSLYGTTFLYKFTTTDGNICSWFASSPLVEPETITKITGTVKDHTTYEEVKETQLTRCKVVDRVSSKAVSEYAEADVSGVDEAFNMFYEATN